MALALGSKRLVIGLRPRTEFATQVGPEMHGIAQGLVALATQMDAMNLAGLKTDRRRASQTLQTLCVRKQDAVVADFRQEPRRDLIAGSRQRLEQCRIRMLREQPADLLTVFIDLGLQELQLFGPHY